MKTTEKHRNFIYLLVLIWITIFMASCRVSLPPQKLLSSESSLERADYRLLESWAAHPEKKDYADSVPVPSLSDRQAYAEADVFYIHPTTYLDRNGGWNASIYNQKVNQVTDTKPILHQASIFNSVGKIYAPRYRQANIKAYYLLEEGGKEALQTAYSDVKAAFLYYLEHWNQGRPIIIASHSQGSTHALLLLKEFFDGKPLQNQLVVAYIPGMPFKAGEFNHIPLCEFPFQTGCYAAWSTYQWRYLPEDYHKWYAESPVVNPVTWLSCQDLSIQENHKGLVSGKYNKIYPKALEASIYQHVLWITKPSIPLSFLVKMKNYHIGDFNIFWLDVRENAELRWSQFKQQQAAKVGNSD